MLLYTEGWKKNLCEQVTEPANACFQMRQEENLIISMIKAIIRRKKGGKNSDPKTSQLESITAQSAAAY